MNILISVIVPVYNVSLYLADCLNSILNQTYRQIEIIVIDDGSTDNGFEICKEFAKQDARIKVIQQENQGLSEARNTGIDLAAGDYFVFIDSDDWIHPQMIEILFNNIEEEHCDLSVCSFYRETNFVDKYGKIQNDVKIYSGLEAFHFLFDDEKSIEYTVAWNKLYKKDLFQEIRYPKGLKYEDGFIAHKILYRCKKVVYSSAPLYYYRQREGNLMKAPFSIREFDRVESRYQRMNFVIEIGDTKVLKRAIHEYLYELINIEKELKKHKKVIDKLDKFTFYKYRYNNYYDLNRKFIMKHCIWYEKIIFALFRRNILFYKVFTKIVKHIKYLQRAKM